MNKQIPLQTNSRLNLDFNILGKTHHNVDMIFEIAIMITYEDPEINGPFKIL